MEKKNKKKHKTSKLKSIHKKLSQVISAYVTPKGKKNMPSLLAQNNFGN